MASNSEAKEMKKAKRKKKVPVEDGVGQEHIVEKKKRKLRNDEEKAKPKVKKIKKSANEKPDAKMKNGEMKKQSKSKKKAAMSTSAQKSAPKPPASKTMDYKQYHLKKMKGKWKKDNTKRIRQKDEAKLASSPKKLVDKKEKKAQQKSVESKKGKAPQKPKQDFDICDFSELLHYWKDFAASSLTNVEAEELSLTSIDSERIIMNQKGRKPHKFLAKRVPDWTKWLKKKLPEASPRIVIICGSALRAVELNKSLAPFKTEKCRVAKLIKRMQTAKQQAEFISNHVVHMAIGTPHRIGLLLSHESLKLDACRVIALDWSYRDPKKRRLIDIPEVRKDVMELFKKYFIPLLKERDDVSLFLF